MPTDWAPAAVVCSIAFATAIYYTAKAWFNHRERMAKIQQGMNPDYPPQKDVSE